MSWFLFLPVMMHGFKRNKLRIYRKENSIWEVMKSFLDRFSISKTQPLKNCRILWAPLNYWSSIFGICHIYTPDRQSTFPFTCVAYVNTLIVLVYHSQTAKCSRPLNYMNYTVQLCHIAASCKKLSQTKKSHMSYKRHEIIM